MNHVASAGNACNACLQSYSAQKMVDTKRVAHHGFARVQEAACRTSYAFATPMHQHRATGPALKSGGVGVDSASDRVPGPKGLDSSNFLARVFLNPLLKKLVAIAWLSNANCFRNEAYRRKPHIPLGERAQFFADCFRSVVTKNQLSEPPVLAHAAAACRALKSFALPLSACLFHRPISSWPSHGSLKKFSTPPLATMQANGLMPLLGTCQGFRTWMIIGQSHSGALAQGPFFRKPAVPEDLGCSVWRAGPIIMLNEDRDKHTQSHVRFRNWPSPCATCQLLSFFHIHQKTSDPNIVVLVGAFCPLRATAGERKLGSE